MSTLMKRVFLCIIGLLAGLASWATVELIIIQQAKFPSYLLFSITLGVIVGIFMSGFFGTSEGIFLADGSKIIKGIITGIIVGTIGGTAGFLIGQAILFAAGNNLAHSVSDINKIALPLTRTIGWSILGIFIGITEGIRSFSFRKIKVGFLGGMLGGITGGLAVEYLPRILDNLLVARLVGFLSFGFFIGIFYGIIEKTFSLGILKLLNGKYKGKEFLINQKRIKIGSSSWSDIKLSDYEDIDPIHAEIFVKRKNVNIRNKSKESIIKVNDDITEQKELKFEDVIQIGSAKFIFKYS